MTIVTAGVVLLLDSNWVAFVILSVVVLVVVAWVGVVYRSGMPRYPAGRLDG